ncbi:MAG: DUF4783 domain-containing protein [Bacteroidia bacterium]|nr:DUF4783 domain-containing protein [Bacteroidia bacterium]
MKVFLYFFSVIAVIITQSCFAQQKSVVPNGIILSLKSGNSAELAKFFNTSVEVTILDKEEIYSKNQAELVIKDFFAKHQATNFTVVHEGGKEGAQYAIGNLTTNNGTFRVYILLKPNQNNLLIHTLRIENEDE